VEDEAGHLEVVTHCERGLGLVSTNYTWGSAKGTLTIDAGVWADLVLLLGGHDFSVDAGDVDTSV
jgi:hypothetical protein